MGPSRGTSSKFAKRVAAALKALGAPDADPAARDDVDRLLDKVESEGEVSAEELSALRLAAGLLADVESQELAARICEGLTERLVEDGWVAAAEVVFDRLADVDLGRLEYPKILNWAPTVASVGRLAKAVDGTTKPISEAVAGNPSAWIGSAVGEWALLRGDAKARRATASLAVDRLVEGDSRSRELIRESLRGAKAQALAAVFWRRAAKAAEAADALWRLVLADNELAVSEPRRLAKTIATAASVGELLPAIAALRELTTSDLATRAGLALAMMRLQISESGIVEGRRIPTTVADYLAKPQVQGAKDALSAGEDSSSEARFVLSAADLGAVLASVSESSLSPAQAEWVVDALDAVGRGDDPELIVTAMAQNLGLEPVGAVGDQVDFDPMKHDGDGKARPGDLVQIRNSGWRLASGVIVRHPRVGASE